VDVMIWRQPTEGVVRIHAHADGVFERALEGSYLDLLRLAVLLARSEQEGEDALQTALERAWRARDQLDDPSLLKAWLRKIVVREVMRRQTSPWSRLVRPATPFDLSSLVSQGSGEVQMEVMEALARLPVAQHVAVVLHHYAGYRIDEVSEMVGAPAETVRSRLRVAMASLRTELAQ
jgi:RNA polymerase sigma-70 factor, ECF subfamily